MKKIITLIILCTALTATVSAQTDDTQAKKIAVKARIGYSIGGTAPIGLPATIRKIEAYRLTPALLVGADVAFAFDKRWGLMTGLHLENKAMNADAATKAYRMEVVKGDSKIEGLFTGHVKQKVTEWMFTLPIEATLALSRKVTLKAGPYFSLLVSKKFDGIAADGYIRQNDPTGPRINMGDKEGEWATYDFSEDMRNLQMGIAAGVDWQLHRNIGLSADVNWGLTGIFKKDFKTVEQTLYPIYGTIGAFYKF